LQSDDPSKRHAAVIALYSQLLDHDDAKWAVRSRLPALISLFTDANPSTCKYAALIFNTLPGYLYNSNPTSLQVAIERGLIDQLLLSLIDSTVSTKLKQIRIYLLSEIAKCEKKPDSYASVIANAVLRLNIIPWFLTHLQQGSKSNKIMITNLLSKIMCKDARYPIAEIQDALHQSGALPKLLDLLLHSRSNKVRHNALCCLGNMVVLNTACKNGLLNLWGAKELKAFLQREPYTDMHGWLLKNLVNNNTYAQDVAREAGIISVMASKLRQHLNNSPAAISQALGNLAKNNENNQNFIREEGIFNALITLLKSNKISYREAALYALFFLAENNHKNQHMIRVFGGIEAVVAALRSNTINSTEAIEIIAENNVENQDAFRAAGVIPILVEMLINSDKQKAAYWTLLQLSKHNVANLEQSISAINRLRKKPVIRSNLAMLLALSKYRSQIIRESASARRASLVNLRASFKAERYQNDLKAEIAANNIDGLRAYVNYYRNQSGFYTAVKRILDDKSLGLNGATLNVLAMVIPSHERHKAASANALSFHTAAQGSDGATGASSNVASAGP
jgi:hypothetical protein